MAEPGCGAQFRAAVRVIQGLPRSGECGRAAGPRGGGGSSAVTGPGGGRGPAEAFAVPQARTGRPTRRCCASTATTSRRRRGAARAPGPASGTPSAGTSGKGGGSGPLRGRCRPGPAPPDGAVPRRDAWHSLGRMSKEEAMAAYVAEMKKVAQKVAGSGTGPARCPPPGPAAAVAVPRSSTRCPWTRRRGRCSSTSSRSTR